MGFFSLCDAKTEISIPAYPGAGLPKEASDIVVVFPDDSTIKGIYDGYGKVGQFFIPEILTKVMKKDPAWQTPEDWTDFIKFVRKDNYNGEKYKQLKKSKNCKYQGYGYPDSMRDKIVKSLPEKLPEQDKGKKPKIDKSDKRMVTLKFKKLTEQDWKTTPVTATETVPYAKIKDNPEKEFEKLIRKVFDIEKTRSIKCVNKNKDLFYFTASPKNIRLTGWQALQASDTIMVEAVDFYKHAEDEAFPSKTESSFKQKILSKYLIQGKQDSLKYNVYDSEHRSKKIGSFVLTEKEFLSLNDLASDNVKKFDSTLTEILKKNSILKKGYLNGSGDGDTLYSWLVGISGETVQGYDHIFIEIDDKDEKLYHELYDRSISQSHV